MTRKDIMKTFLFLYSYDNVVVLTQTRSKVIQQCSPRYTNVFTIHYTPV